MSENKSRHVNMAGILVNGFDSSNFSILLKESEASKFSEPFREVMEYNNSRRGPEHFLIETEDYIDDQINRLNNYNAQDNGTRSIPEYIYEASKDHPYILKNLNLSYKYEDNHGAFALHQTSKLFDPRTCNKIPLKQLMWSRGSIVVATVSIYPTSKGKEKKSKKPEDQYTKAVISKLIVIKYVKPVSESSDLDDANNLYNIEHKDNTHSYDIEEESRDEGTSFDFN